MDKSLILKEIKKHYNFKTDGEFADFLGIKQNTLSNWATRNSIDYDRIITKCEDIDANWLLTGKGDMLKKEKDLATAAPVHKGGFPLLPIEAFAGLGDTNVSGVDFETIEERYVIPLFDGLKIDFMIAVRGSSMYPKYSSGDVVACRLISELLFIQWNKVYVLDSKSQGVIMKRVKKSQNPDFILCKSDNKDYDEFEIPRSDIRNIALVVGVIRLE
ncbi:helix-turn-helix domain-containing protein [Flavobacterium sp.]|uniref:LexA family transcriptional regulator n=1 Tax=Flavobacterium sp. TaxID=239 RepID=UPI0026043363|nr:helix-turn-helix domain-containing protein [Flavobacterium sp.]